MFTVISGDGSHRGDSTACPVHSKSARPKSRILGACLACVVLLGTQAGCSNTADPAEVREIASQFSSSESNPVGVPITDEAAECRAEVYLESDLSVRARESLRETGLPTSFTTKDVEELQEIADRIARECV